MQNKQRYKITDPEGSKLFFETIAQPQKLSDDEIAEINKRTRRRKLSEWGTAAIVVIVLIVLAGGYLIKRFIDIESMNRKINDIIERENFYDHRLNLSGNSEDDMNVTAASADSIIFSIEQLMLEYPKQDTLKTLWSYIQLKKYEVYIFNKMYKDEYDDILNIDDSIVTRVAKYNPEMLSVIPLYKNVINIQEYWFLYPDPPLLSQTPPKKRQVEQLIGDIKAIQDSISNSGSFMEISFPFFFKYIKHLSNSVFPNIWTWKSFWDRYNTILSNSADKLSNQSMMVELRQEFPNLGILKSSGVADFGYSRLITLGISSYLFTPSKSNQIQEWNPIVQYVSSKTKFKIVLKEFLTPEELFDEFQNKNVDLAVFDLGGSAGAFFAGVGVPVAQRVWNKKGIIKMNLVSTNQLSLPLTKSVNSKIGFFNIDRFMIYDYLEKLHIQPSQVKTLEINYSVDSLVKHFNNGDINMAVISDEEYYHLEHDPGLKKSLYKVQEITEVPLSVLWARDGLETDIIKTLQAILVPMEANDLYKTAVNPALKPYSDWDFYPVNSMGQFYDELNHIMLKTNSVLNRIYIKPIAYEGKELAEKIHGTLSQHFQKMGFTVIDNVDENEDEFFSKTRKIATLKMERDKDNNWLYYLQIEANDGKGNNRVVYSKTFKEGDGDFPPEYHRKLLDIPQFVPIFGSIKSVQNNEITVYFSVKPQVIENEVVRIYEKRKTGSVNPKSIGSGLVISSDEHKMTVKVTSGIQLIKVGDVVELPHEENK